jgi:hypothetical protein
MRAMRKLLAAGFIGAIAIVGALAPARGQQGLGIASAHWCPKAAIYDASTNGATQLVALGAPIYICGFTLWSGGTVAVDLIYGTGTNCATGAVKVTPAFALTTQTGIADTSPLYRGLYVPPGQALCLNTGGGVAVQAIVYYDQ